MRKILVFVILAASAILVSAQDKTGYQLPPEAIVSLLDAPQTPSVILSSDNQTMLLLHRPGLPSIAELSQPELRLAGVRFNPSTNGPSRVQGMIRISSMKIDGTETGDLKGLPSGASLGGVTWSHDNKRFAFTNTTGNTIELWVADAATMTAQKIDEGLNNVLQRNVTWLPDGSLIYLRTLRNRGKAPNYPRCQRVLRFRKVKESGEIHQHSRTFCRLLTMKRYLNIMPLLSWSDGMERLQLPLAARE